MENGAVFQKSVWRSIFSLCVPTLVSIVVMMLYNMADMYFVGWLDDYAQVAAVSLAGPVFSVLMGISTMIGNGGCTKIAQALGADDLERVRSDSALCVWASVISGAVFAVVCVLFCDPLLRLLGANAEMWDPTKSYVLIMALGAPIVLLNHSLGGALRGEGEITAGLVGGMVSTVSNIILDPIFILVLKLGVGGAAAATVLGNTIALGYYMVYKAKSHGRCIIELRPRYARDLRALGAILALGLPNAISSVLSGFAGTFSNRLLVGYGTQAVAAMGAAGKASMVVTMVQMGVCMGVQPLLAYCCGGQVLPQGEDGPDTGALGMARDGEFYHYMLGNLAASAAAIQPEKRGRAMCEIFGNYGWAEGVRLEKYLADHFLVRGINYFVPHAFSPAPFPDPDCPPHFYAHGHNPQYRHFGALMGYMNRVSSLTSGGHRVSPVAILYHGEAEWAGKAMLSQKPARVLAEAQIEYDCIPCGVFAEPERYRTVLGNPRSAIATT